MDLYNINEIVNGLEYSVEYAPLNKTSCQKCYSIIGHNFLRLSQNLRGTGISPRFFHLDCFFATYRRNKDINEASFRGIDALRWDDQERLREKIKEQQKSCNKHTGNLDETLNLPCFSDFKVEHSKSNRGKCADCGEYFKLGELKFCYKSRWTHRLCCLKERPHGFVEDFKGFDKLKPEAQTELRSQFDGKTAENIPLISALGDNNVDLTAETSQDDVIIPPKTNLPTIRKTPIRDDTESPPPEVPLMKKFCFDKPSDSGEELKAKLKQQSDVMWEIREQLTDAFDRSKIIEVLKFNGQMYNTMHERSTDELLTHLVDCATFGKPAKCDKCTNGLMIYSLSLRSYGCIGYVSEFTRCVNIDPNPPRLPFQFPPKFITKYPLAKKLQLNRFAKRLYPVEHQDARKNEMLSLDLKSRVATEQYMEGIKPNVDEHGVSKKIVKFGTAVDGEFERAAQCHVYRDEEGTLYSTTLHQTDVLMNSNSYFKMQILKDDVSDNYYVFTSWGRIGTNRGGKHTISYYNPKGAVNYFYDTFKEKTFNNWHERKYFVKKPGGYMLVETDYSELENVKQNSVVPGSQTKLHRAIKELILMISDLRNINNAMNNVLKLDTTRMPLGKLSKQQITNAYVVLTEAQNLITNGGAQQDVLDATNRFYSLVPHDFGMNNADLLDNMEIIKKKCEMLDSLIDFQLAYDFLNKSDMTMDIDPVDVHYQNLHCKMEYVEPSSDEYQLIEKYLKNSHGATHDSYKLKVIDIIRLDREGEDEKFMKHLGNRKLLWHGSGTGNFVGILSQGLRIAPPEAPVHGYMFGKGVYFADMVSKSANYCSVNRTNSDGLILLCDVALGNMQLEYHAKNISKPKAGFSSVKGCGRNYPIDDVYNHPDGYTMALNGITTDNANIDSFQLIYNEYIVYNVNQIRMKYIVRANFKYR